MKIENNVLRFESIGDMFYKERVGIKPNTVRIMSYAEMNYILSSAPTKIMITEIETERNFVRSISDISYFVSNLCPNILICTFSWND